MSSLVMVKCMKIFFSDLKKKILAVAFKEVPHEDRQSQVCYGQVYENSFSNLKNNIYWLLHLRKLHLEIDNFEFVLQGQVYGKINLNFFLFFFYGGLT